MKTKNNFLGLSGAGFMMHFVRADALWYWTGTAMVAAYGFLESVFSGQLFALVAKLANQTAGIWQHTVFVLCLLLFIILLTGTGEILFTKAAAQVDFHLRDELGRRMARIPLKHWYQKHSGECMTIFGKDSDTASEIYKVHIPVLISLILQAAGGLIVLVIASPLYACYAFVWGVCYLWIGMFSRTRWRTHSAKQRQFAADSASTFTDLLSGFPVIRMYESIRGKLLGKHRDEVEQSFAAGRQIARISTQNRGLWQLGYTLSYSGTFFVGLLLVYAGNIDLSNMLALWPVAMGVAFAITQLGFFVSELQPVMAATDRVRELFETPPEQSGNRSDIPDKTPLISFAQVNFSYQDDIFALNDCSFCIYEGEKVALVGESGSGKSTVVKLMMNLYAADKGEVRFCGVSVGDYRMDVLRSQFGYVPQSPHILSAPLIENISVVADAPHEHIINMAKAACVDEFTDSLGDGYDTYVTENTLSGGQRQRIGIARALVKSARVLVLDEITAALDGQTEADIYRGIADCAAGRTMIMITHRLSAAAMADRILVFSQGKVAEEGTHSELMLKNGLYTQLWAMHEA